MNVLPIVLALVLILSVITIERLDKFKNQTIVQHHTQEFLSQVERQEFNRRQELLFLKTRKTHRQLSFRYIVNKELRERDANIAKQYRQMTIDLIKVLYQHTGFYKEMERENPKFVEDLITEIENAADESGDKTIKRVEDIGRLKLANPRLQNVFYHMLKGTVSRADIFKEEKELREKKQILSPEIKKKQYVSLLTYIHLKKSRPEIQLAPKELLEAIFNSDAVAEQVMQKRQELAKNQTSGSQEEFRSEFNPKRKVGLDDQILDFKITKSDKKKYN
jgi:hypothetical protein